MKNFAKLTLFFSLSYIAFFSFAILIVFISSWIDMARLIPVEVRIGQEVAGAAWKALTAAIYISILLSLNYCVRRRMPQLFSIACIILLACIFTVAATIGVSRTGAIKPIFNPVSPIRAGPGLILTQSDNVIVLLKENREVRGPRLVSIPGRPLIYQELPIGPYESIISLPALQFGEETPWFLKSIAIDFTIGAAELQRRLSENFLYFGAYCLSLILLLSSLRVLQELSQWPLANLFLGVLAFRGVLALETFLNSREINALIGSFLNKMVPPVMITPVIFTALGVLIIIYTLLSSLAGRKRVKID